MPDDLLLVVQKGVESEISFQRIVQFVLHGNVADAEFHGYWFDSTLKSSQKGILVSWYELPAGASYRYLIVAGNFSRNEQPAGIGKLPWKITFSRELWTEREVTENDLRTMRIPANHFRLIGIR